MSALAVVVARGGRLPVGAVEAVSEAGGRVVVVGSGAADAARSLPGVTHARWCETGPGFAPAWLAAALAPVIGPETLVLLPASPDGRDLAPRLAAATGRPLVARALAAEIRADGDAPVGVRASVARIEDRMLVPVDVAGPVVATLAVGGRAAVHPAGASPDAVIEELVLAPCPDGDGGPAGGDPELVELLEPDLHTMDLADATRVVSGGAGLVSGLDDARATETFTLLRSVAAALGGSAGATRVATDAGWTGYERQIGTTGVAVDPDLYIAFGVSGAVQHTAGLGAPRHLVSVNTDPSCPMTAMADLGLVTDARALLVELAGRLGVEVPVTGGRQPGAGGD
ncbi:MAG: mycofactocin-associated electron transfer flavoprotein alpha subunit [Acidimicrobiales bacterium]